MNKMQKEANIKALLKRLAVGEKGLIRKAEEGTLDALYGKPAIWNLRRMLQKHKRIKLHKKHVGEEMSKAHAKHKAGLKVKKRKKQLAIAGVGGLSGGALLAALLKKNKSGGQDAETEALLASFGKQSA